VNVEIENMKTSIHKSIKSKKLNVKCEKRKKK
jgi:hypothetical protein